MADPRVKIPVEKKRSQSAIWLRFFRIATVAKRLNYAAVHGILIPIKFYFVTALWTEGTEMNLNDEEVSRLIQNLFRFNHYLRRRGQAGGLRPGEVAILRCLLHNAQEGRPELKPSQISAILGLQQPSITPSLHSLEARGYVQRRGGEQDRREVYFSATEKTIALSVEERRRSAERISDLAAYLGEEDTRRLMETMERVGCFLDLELEAATQASTPRRGRRKNAADSL